VTFGFAKFKVCHMSESDLLVSEVAELRLFTKQDVEIFSRLNFGAVQLAGTLHL